MIILDPKELSKITHEINDIYYPKFKGKSIAMHRSIDLNGDYCIYYFRIIDFDEYIFIDKFLD